MPDIDPSTLVESAAQRVRDPITGRSLAEAGRVAEVRVDQGVLLVDLQLTAGFSDRDRRGIKQAIKANVQRQGWEGDVAFHERPVGEESAPKQPSSGPGKDPVPGMSGGGMQPHGGPIDKQPIEGVTHVIAVSSAKGGVGKSTVATNLAVALANQDHAVGLLDADVYGPSLPRMMNVSGRPMVDQDQRIIPPTSYGVKCLSVGLLVDDAQAIIWRGPMVMQLVRQFLQQARWGDLDYLVVDLPPGTGDAQLTLIQATDIDGSVIVTTPQDVALADAVRGITMFRKLEVPVLGLVENMAWYELPDGTRDHVFGKEGGKRLAEREGIDLLAQIPLQTSVRKSGDQGLPAALGDDAVAVAFADLAATIAEKLPVDAA